MRQWCGRKCMNTLWIRVGKNWIGAREPNRLNITLWFPSRNCQGIYPRTSFSIEPVPPLSTAEMRFGMSFSLVVLAPNYFVPKLVKSHVPAPSPTAFCRQTTSVHVRSRGALLVRWILSDMSFRLTYEPVIWQNTLATEGFTTPRSQVAHESSRSVNSSSSVSSSRA